MKIGIDIRSTLKKTTGIGKYTFSLINALAKVDHKNEYCLYSQKKLLDFKRRLPCLPGRNFSHRVDYFKKGPGVFLPDTDVFHTSSYDLKKPKRAKYIVTIHDVIIKSYPYGHSKKTIKEIDEKLVKTLDEADVLVADSYNTKADLVRFYGVDKGRIQVVYPGVKTRGGRWGVKGEESEDYILFVGTLEPRKNVNRLIQAFNFLKKEFDIKHKLYIVGMKGWMFEGIFKEYEDSEFKKDIIFKGYVSERELQGLYKGASVFCYPSFYEGFGFPVVEAFSYGVPVVTSKTSSCGEVAGDSALLVDPSSHEEIARTLFKVIDDSSLAKVLSLKGINRARDFSWDRTAQEFVKLFTQRGI